MLFHKGVGENIGVTNFVSKFSMFVLTRDNVKLADDNMANDQVIDITLCQFPNCTDLYPMGPFLTVQVILQKKYHQVPLNVMPILKFLHKNYFNNVTLSILKAILGGQNI